MNTSRHRGELTDWELAELALLSPERQRDYLIASLDKIEPKSTSIVRYPNEEYLIRVFRTIKGREPSRSELDNLQVAWLMGRLVK